jgi:hypothetical protein
VYVTQPEVKPGCVLRRANIGLLEKKQLVTDHEVRRLWCAELLPHPVGLACHAQCGGTL